MSAPKKSVSTDPRILSSLSVNTCPRSGSPQSCISSIATNSAPISCGIASTVQTQYRALLGTIRSSPVIKATEFNPRKATTLS